MKKTFLLSVMGTMILGGSVLLAEPAATQPTTKAVDPTPVNKNCMVEAENPIDPKVATVVYQGKTYGFCCKDCIQEFKDNPEKYLKGK